MEFNIVAITQEETSSSGSLFSKIISVKKSYMNARDNHDTMIVFKVFQPCGYANTNYIEKKYLFSLWRSYDATKEIVSFIELGGTINTLIDCYYVDNEDCVDIYVKGSGKSGASNYVQLLFSPNASLFSFYNQSDWIKKPANVLYSTYHNKDHRKDISISQYSLFNLKENAYKEFRISRESISINTALECTDTSFTGSGSLINIDKLYFPKWQLTDEQLETIETQFILFTADYIYYTKSSTGRYTISSSGKCKLILWGTGAITVEELPSIEEDCKLEVEIKLEYRRV